MSFESIHIPKVYYQNVEQLSKKELLRIVRDETRNCIRCGKIFMLHDTLTCEHCYISVCHEHAVRYNNDTILCGHRCGRCAVCGQLKFVKHMVQCTKCKQTCCEHLCQHKHVKK